MRPIVGCTLLLAVLASIACHTMKPVSLEQLDVLKPNRVWVTNPDQSMVVVSRPQVVGDTVVGYVDGTYEQLPSAGLKQVTVQTLSPARTAMLVGGIAAGLGVFFVAISEDVGPHAVYPIGNCDKHPTDPGCL
jgi:hypothetical protein